MRGNWAPEGLPYTLSRRGEMNAATGRSFGVRELEPESSCGKRVARARSPADAGLVNARSALSLRS